MPILGGALAPEYLPTPEDVHGLMANRPLFTDTSKPSRGEVVGFIESAAASLSAEVGMTLPEKFIGKARLIVMYHAASQAELSMFPEQNFGNASQTDELWNRYQSELLGLRALLGETTAGGGRRGKVGSIRLGVGLAPPPSSECRRIL